MPEDRIDTSMVTPESEPHHCALPSLTPEVVETSPHPDGPIPIRVRYPYAPETRFHCGTCGLVWVCVIDPPRLGVAENRRWRRETRRERRKRERARGIA